MNTVLKDPDAVLDFGLDWAAGGSNDGSATDTGWLQSGTIATSSWSISGPDSVLIEDSDANDTTTATIVLSAGTVNRTYIVTNHIITASGLEDDRSITVKVQER